MKTLIVICMLACSCSALPGTNTEFRPLNAPIDAGADSYKIALRAMAGAGLPIEFADERAGVFTSGWYGTGEFSSDARIRVFTNRHTVRIFVDCRTRCPRRLRPELAVDAAKRIEAAIKSARQVNQ